MGKLITSLLYSLKFLFKTRLRAKTISRICKELSQRYLTTSYPGQIEVPRLGLVMVVTASTGIILEFPRLQSKYVLNRVTFEISQWNESTKKWIEYRPIWESRAVLGFFKHLKKTGVNVPYNMNGVTYYKMPEEEEFNAGNA